MNRLFLAFQFLTIVPIRTKAGISESDITGSSAYFPVVGFAQGLLLAFASWVLLNAFSLPVTSALLIVIYLVVNGGFHQDGLSDTFDALSVKSSGNPAEDRLKRLAIMRDATSGPIGITAIALFLLLKCTLLGEVVGLSHRGLNPVIVLMPMISAFTMTMVMPGAKSARNDGLGKIFLGRVRTGHAAGAFIFVVVFSAIVYIAGYVACPFAMRNFVTYLAGSLAASLLAGYGLRAIFNARFGGLTGDNLGCIHEVSEIFTLLAAVFLQSVKGW